MAHPYTPVVSERELSCANDKQAQQQQAGTWCIGLLETPLRSSLANQIDVCITLLPLFAFKSAAAAAAAAGAERLQMSR